MLYHLGVFSFTLAAMSDLSLPCAYLVYHLIYHLGACSLELAAVAKLGLPSVFWCAVLVYTFKLAVVSISLSFHPKPGLTLVNMTAISIILQDHDTSVKIEGRGVSLSSTEKHKAWPIIRGSVKRKPFPSNFEDGEANAQFGVVQKKCQRTFWLSNRGRKRWRFKFQGKRKVTKSGWMAENHSEQHDQHILFHNTTLTFHCLYLL